MVSVIVSEGGEKQRTRKFFRTQKLALAFVSSVDANRNRGSIDPKSLEPPMVRLSSFSTYALDYWVQNVGGWSGKHAQGSAHGLRDACWFFDGPRTRSGERRPFDPNEYIKAGLPTFEVGMGRSAVVGEPINRITAKDCVDLLNSLSLRRDGALVNHTTLKRRYGPASRVFEMAFAVEPQLNGTTSPMKVAISQARQGLTVRLPPATTKASALTDEEFGEKVLAKTTKQWQRAAWGLMFWAGLRPEEVRGLQVGDIHFDKGEHGRIVLARTVTASGTKYTQSGKQSEVGPLKHRKWGETRSIPVARELAPILSDAITGKGPTDPVVCTPRGGVIGVKTLERGWNAIRDASPEISDGSYLLRRSFGSRLGANGADAALGSKLMGNSPEVFNRHYLRHLHRDDGESVINP